MATLGSDSRVSEIILRAVCAVKNGAWCFVPVGRDHITHCSRSFLELWSLPGTVSVESGEIIPLGEGRLADAMDQLGLPTDMLSRFCRDAVSDECQLPAQSLIAKIFRKEVIDGDANVVGAMLVCHSRSNVSVSKEVWNRASQSREKLGVLSPRETEILELVFQGTTNKMIGRIASISEKTVEKHRSRIMRKLGSRNLADLIRCVTEANMISPDGSSFEPKEQEIGS